MGYTHFWTYQPNNMLDTEKLRRRFRVAVDIIEKAYKKVRKNRFIHEGNAGGFYKGVPCIIRGGLGKGTPIINESEVWFNGDENTGTDHETFGIRWFPSGGAVNGFCKTARKPYDILVCVSLLAFKHAFNDPNVFSFSSDGDNADWEDAKDLFTRITGSFVGEIFAEESNLEVV